MAKRLSVIDVDRCVGCQSCEIACKMEHNRPPDEWGIQVQKVEPEIAGGKLYYFPFPTDNCNLCSQRRAQGLLPSCVQHCWAGVIKFGTIEDLARYMKEKPKTVLWRPH